MNSSDRDSLPDLDSRFEWSVRYCEHCESEQGGGIADRGDLACSACGRHDAPHEYVPIVEAKALAEALEWIYAEFVDGCMDEQWARDTDPVVGRAYEAFTAYRARHPKESP